MSARLFEPLRLDDLELENRIIIAPMCQYSALAGAATDWHLMHLGQLAQSGAGLLTLEATAVSPEARISPGDLGLYDDATERALARVLGAVRGTAPIPVAIQINHAGRKASSRAPWEGGAQIAPDAADGWQTEAPSAIPHAESEAPPHALDAEGLRRVREGFVATAKRAMRLGIDAVELHGAHGYLLHQFLSPVANRRTDAYGGSLENRMRFPLEVFEAVRAAVSAHIAVGVRLSATDWLEGEADTESWTVEQSIAFVQAIEARGADFIHVSSGGVSPRQKIALGPNYQVPFAERIRAACGLPTIAVGLITEPAQAEAIVADAKADFVAVARAILFEPHWPWRAAAELGASVQAPPQYWRSQPRDFKNVFGPDARIGQR